MNTTRNIVVPLQSKNKVRQEVLDPETTLIRIKEVMAITGMARATLYKTMKYDPKFPKSVKLNDSDARSAPVGFVLGEVRDWVRARIAAREEQP